MSTDTLPRETESDLHALGQAIWTLNRLLDDLGRGTTDIKLISAIGWAASEAETIFQRIERAALATP